MATQADVVAALRSVQFPGIDRDIVTLGYVKDVTESAGRFRVRVELSPTASTAADAIDASIRNALERAEIPYELELKTQKPAAPAAAAPSAGDSDPLAHVPFKIAVSSGKGGVGKSTVAVNLAVALAKQGLRTGLLDTDIYGPSIPLMMGLEDSQPLLDEENNRLIPLERYEVKNISIGYLVDRHTPVIWRGPMIGKAIDQLMRDVDWSDIDVLLFDLPPGTGDIQISLAQKVVLSGAVVVTTPQDVALIDAAKGVEMFRKTDVPILGIVENMSFFACPHCGERTDIFGSGGGEKEANRMDVPFLGRIPLEPSIRIGGDEGRPIVVREPESAAARAFLDVAASLAASLQMSR
ncbi:MAG: Mrp/NBP35 family ATP-binding protein [Candidatus Eisenbacteria bacterium]|uniref:Iron-sulfur cluster carrier protein n=1 Tax=Eiseniibacteriota bacterium TaxID=2212470 RepID=A0A956RNY0_UNCEI|nr:Mrp/NBP35 family ATP-binding protein [Candidatus Eisenbacteria bacterium]